MWWSCSSSALIDDANQHGETALHQAALRGSLAVVQCLLKHGADPDLPNHSGEAALHYALRGQREDVVALLLKEGADVNQATAAGKTPLLLAEESRSESLVTMLREATAGQQCWKVAKAKGKWPVPRHCPSAAVYNDRLYLYGGSDSFSRQPRALGRVHHGDMWMFNGLTLEWRGLSPMGEGPPPLSRHSSAILGNRLYVFGGCNDKGTFNNLYVLNIEEMMWSEVHVAGPYVIRPRSGHSSTAISDEEFLVIGGSCDEDYFNDVHVFNCKERSWRRQKTKSNERAPAKRHLHTATLVGRRVYVFGGCDDRQLFDDVRALDLDTWEWTAPRVRGRLPFKACGHAALAINNTVVLIYGGLDEHGAHTKEIFAFDTASFTWNEYDTSAVQHQLERAGHVLFVLNNAIYGYGGNQLFAMHELRPRVLDSQALPVSGEVLRREKPPLPPKPLREASDEEDSEEGETERHSDGNGGNDDSGETSDTEALRHHVRCLHAEGRALLSLLPSDSPPALTAAAAALGRRIASFDVTVSRPSQSPPRVRRTVTSMAAPSLPAKPQAVPMPPAKPHTLRPKAPAPNLPEKPQKPSPPAALAVVSGRRRAASTSGARPSVRAASVCTSRPAAPPKPSMATLRPTAPPKPSHKRKSAADVMSGGVLLAPLVPAPLPQVEEEAPAVQEARQPSLVLRDERGDVLVPKQPQSAVRLTRTVAEHSTATKFVLPSVEDPLAHYRSITARIPQRKPTTWKDASDKRLRQRSKVVDELVATEAAYVQDLAVLVGLYRRPLEHEYAGCLLPQHVEALFGNVEALLEVNLALLARLLEVEQQPPAQQEVGRVFLEAQEGLGRYVAYCTNQKGAMEALEKLEASSEAFGELLTRQKAMAESRRQDLASYLIKPFQRVTRYPLLLREVAKVTPKHSADTAPLAEAMLVLDRVVSEANEAKRLTDNVVKMIEVQSGFAWQGEEGQLKWSPDCRFIAEGKFKEFDVKTKSSSRRHFFLFNEMIVIAKPLKGGRFKKQDVISTGALLLWDLKPGQGDLPKNVKYAFQLVRTDHTDRLIVCASSQMEKDSWMAAINGAIASYMAPDFGGDGGAT